MGPMARWGAVRGLGVAVLLMTAVGGCKGDGAGGGDAGGNGGAVDRLVTAVGAGQEGGAFLSSDGVGAWSASGTLSVPAGATLVVGASGVNADLDGAQVTLRSPDGHTITLGGGAVALSGFQAQDLAEASDPALEAYFEDVLLLDLPDPATEQDWSDLFDRWSGADPEHPMPETPDAIMQGLDQVAAPPAGTVALADAARPRDGLIVFGAAQGTWSIEASAAEGSGPFQLIAWAAPDGGGRESIEHVAAALAAAGGTVSGALGMGEGEDPGGAWHLEQFRYPPPDTLEFYRAQAIDVTYKVVQWLTLRGLFTKAIDVVLKFAGVESIVAVGLTKDRLKVLAIFVVATVYREILRYSAIADLWFWRAAYCLNGPDYYFQIFNLGRIVEKLGFESYTWDHEEMLLDLNDFEEIRLLGGNMVREKIKREWWGIGGPFSSPRVGKWSITPATLAQLDVHGEKDGDCTVETLLGTTKPGSGQLTVVVATQPAKVVIPVRVAAPLTLEPDPARLGPGESVTLTCEGHESVAGTLAFAWSAGELYGTVSDGRGHGGTSFESASDHVTYTANADAHDGANDWVMVTVFLEEEGGRVKVGEAHADVQIRESAAPCKVTLATYVAPTGWKWGDPNPNDVTCELASGTWVIDPDSIGGCVTAAECQGQCLGYGEHRTYGYGIQWSTYDAEGTSTGGNHCVTSSNASTCEADVERFAKACGENLCWDPSGDFYCGGCGCACGGGNCYPWKGPGSIVFDAPVSVPCTDAHDCYYFHEPSEVKGTYTFTLVHCGSVDDALPNCPGNVPKPNPR